MPGGPGCTKYPPVARSTGAGPHARSTRAGPGALSAQAVVRGRDPGGPGTRAVSGALRSRVHCKYPGGRAGPHPFGNRMGPHCQTSWAGVLDPRGRPSGVWDLRGAGSLGFGYFHDHGFGRCRGILAVPEMILLALPHPRGVQSDGSDCSFPYEIKVFGPVPGRIWGVLLCGPGVS